MSCASPEQRPAEAERRPQLTGDSMWEKMIAYIMTHGDALLVQIGTHLWISLAALAAAILIGAPCGYLAADLPGIEKWISAPFHVLRVIPSLAILVLLIPIAGTGALSAVIALTILAVPPVLLNTIVGFRDVPPFMTESAAGIGMTDREILWKVRIPLALPMIFAGIRTAWWK